MSNSTRCLQTSNNILDRRYSTKYAALGFRRQHCQSMQFFRASGTGVFHQDTIISAIVSFSHGSVNAYIRSHTANDQILNAFASE